MQTFRAYVQDAAGALTWAAWIEAVDLSEAEGKVSALRLGETPATVELWSATDRRVADTCTLEPV